MREWKFQSSSSPKVYTTQINPSTGLLSCSCPGWITKKLNKTRTCKHTKTVIEDEGLQVEERDGQQFVVAGTSPNPVGKSGEQHWNWKGGTKETAGYIYVYNPSYHRATKGYAKRSDMVLEEKLGRLLEPDEEAHHINHIRSDDAPENLEAKRRADHRREQVKESAAAGAFTGTHANQPRDDGGKFEAKTGFISPMLASKMPEGKTPDSFNTPEWIMEQKFDGHRIVVRIEGGVNVGYHGGSGDNIIILPARITAWSRLGNTRTLPDHLLNILTDMPEGVYDGELIVPGQHSYDVTEGQNSGTEKLVLFDIMEVLGQSVMKESYAKRRDYLCEAFKALDDSQESIVIALQFIPSMTMVETIWSRGGEGAIIKNVHSKYQPGWRTPSWVKVKSVLAATLTVIGYESGKNGPYSVIRLRDDAGIETTVKTLDNKTMRQISLNPDGFINKKLVISYQEKMPSGKYRHPTFDHWAGVGE